MGVSCSYTPRSEASPHGAGGWTPTVSLEVLRLHPRECGRWWDQAWGAGVGSDRGGTWWPAAGWPRRRSVVRSQTSARCRHSSRPRPFPLSAGRGRLAGAEPLGVVVSASRCRPRCTRSETCVSVSSSHPGTFSGVAGTPSRCLRRPAGGRRDGRRPPWGCGQRGPRTSAGLQAEHAPASPASCFRPPAGRPADLGETQHTLNQASSGGKAAGSKCRGDSAPTAGCGRGRLAHSGVTDCAFQGLRGERPCPGHRSRLLSATLLSAP